MLAAYFAFLLLLPVAGTLGANADAEEPADQAVVTALAEEAAETEAPAEATPVVEEAEPPAEPPVEEVVEEVATEEPADEAPAAEPADPAPADPAPADPPPAAPAPEPADAAEATEEATEEEPAEDAAPIMKPLAVDPDFWPYSYETIRDAYGTDDDDVFVGGSKENDLSTWKQDYASPTQDGDIVNGYVGAEIIDGTPFLYVGLDRYGSGGNNGFFLELNQKPNTTNGHNTPVPDRTNGDLRFVFPSGDEFSYPKVQMWRDGAWVSAPADGMDFQSSPLTAEFKVDVTKLLNIELGDFECDSFGFSSFYLRSGASDQDNSQLKDYVTAPISVDFCPDLTIKKVDYNGNGLEGATFRISPDPRDRNVESATFTTGAGGVILIPDARPGKYTVEEIAAPPGYLLPPVDERSMEIELKLDTDATFTFKDPKAPTLTKTATALYDVEYKWQIDKTVDGEKTVEYSVSDDAPEITSEYEVTVTMVEEIRSNYRLSGTITVENPDVAVKAMLADQLADGTVCTIDGVGDDGAVDLAVGTATFDYTCIADGELGDIDMSGSNTATLVVSASSYDAHPTADDMPHVTNTATAEYSFAEDTVVNRTVDVTDTFPEFGEAYEDTTVTADESPKTFTYSKKHSAPAGECVEYTNTAQVIGEDDEVLDEDSTTVTICTRADVEVTKNVITSLDRTYAWSIEKSVDESMLYVDPATGEATGHYTITVTEGAYEDSNWLMTGEITVSNPNQFTDAVVTVTDATNVGGECTVTDGEDATIPAGETVTFEYTCVFTEAPTSYDGINTATVEWTQQEAPSTYDAAFEEADWELTEWLKTTMVSDTFADLAEKYTDEELTLVWSEAGKVHEFTYEHVFTGEEVPAAGECLDVANTASLSTGGESTVDVTLCMGSIELTKSADPATFDAAGQVITYTLTATNTGQIPLTDVTVTDEMLGVEAELCAETLAPGESCSLEFEYTVTQADMDAGYVYNAASTTGIDPGDNPVTDDDDEEVPGVQKPGIMIEKKVDPTGPVYAGHKLTFSFVVTNTGNVTLTNVTVTDPMLAELNLTVTCPVTELAPGEMTTCTTSEAYVVTAADAEAGKVHNVATVTAEDPGGDPVKDDDDVTVEVLKPTPPPVVKPKPPVKPKPVIPSGAPEGLGPNSDLVMAGAALLALAGGATGMAASRRRRS